MKYYITRAELKSDFYQTDYANFFNDLSMDTTLEDRKITWGLTAIYGLVSELVPIIALLLYVFVWGNLINDYNLSFTHEFMSEIGVFILMCIGFLSHAGTSFWIAKRSRTRTLFNGFRLLLTVIVVEIAFYYIVGLDFRLRYSFTFLTYAVGIVLAAITPPVLKGKKTHRKDWDALKDEEYEKKTRK